MWWINLRCKHAANLKSVFNKKEHSEVMKYFLFYLYVFNRWHWQPQMWQGWRASAGPERCPRPRAAQLVFPVTIYTIVFFMGILLNALALWVFIHIPSSSTFVVYLKNTLVADLIMTLTLPFKSSLDARLGPWQLRAFVCRFSAVIFYDTPARGHYTAGAHSLW